MIQAMVVKMIFNLVMKAINKKYDMKSIDNYVHKNNELDIQMKNVYNKVSIYGKYIEILEKEVAELKKLSHSPLFTLKDKEKINKRLKKLERKKK